MQCCIDWAYCEMAIWDSTCRVVKEEGNQRPLALVYSLSPTILSYGSLLVLARELCLILSLQLAACFFVMLSFIFSSLFIPLLYNDKTCAYITYIYLFTYLGCCSHRPYIPSYVAPSNVSTQLDVQYIYKPENRNAASIRGLLFHIASVVL